MIATEQQKVAAQNWIKFWKESNRSGGQSWLAHEGAREEIMLLLNEIKDYDRRKKLDGAAR